MTVMWVFLAGGLGSAARYLIGQWAATALGVGFPYGTLIVNLVGCFALGLVVQLAVAGSWHGDVRAAIAREKQIKTWRREKKLALVSAENPAWDELPLDSLDRGR